MRARKSSTKAQINHEYCKAHRTKREGLLKKRPPTFNSTQHEQHTCAGLKQNKHLFEEEDEYPAKKHQLRTKMHATNKEFTFATQ